MRINVLLCTYNGEKYLREQLDSIVEQTYDDFLLYIRDDGSADGTAGIIEEYCNRYSDKVIELKSHSHIGYPDCFWDILERCDTADLYAFADQDDVWDHRKLERAAEVFSGLNQDYSDSIPPMLYIHDYYNCNASLKRTSIHRLKDIGKLTDMSILFYTFASGFAMIINDSMRKWLEGMKIMGKAMYHDELCIWTAYFHGRILHDDAVLASYRRHDAAVTRYGNRLPSLVSNWFMKEIMGPEFGYKCSRIRTFLLLEEGTECKEDTGKVPDEWRLLSGNGRGAVSYFMRIMYPHRLRPSLGGELALRLLFILNRK